MKNLNWQSKLQDGLVIPACPLMLDENRIWSKRHQRAIVRYYYDAGAGGIAVGVHSTQFAIRDPQHALLEPILRLVIEELQQWPKIARNGVELVKIAGVCGRTEQATAEAKLASELGYHAGLLSLAAMASDHEQIVLEHCRRVADLIPVIGFYLQPAVGGRVFSFAFWQQFCLIPAVIAIKIAPFNRYQTIDVVRAVAESGREDIALYTGNDDNIIVDLLTNFEFGDKVRHIAGGLLGQWGIWTRRAVELLQQIKAVRNEKTITGQWLTENASLTAANAAVFDAAHQFAGCIPGIMEVLRRQGLAPSNRCLNPAEVLSPGQCEELDRVALMYPHLHDDAFVAENLTRWLY